MEYLIYKSKARVSPDSAACHDIVAASRFKNADLGLTGFLHAEVGLFIQYLEGPSEPLWALYQRLHLDSRHTDLTLFGHGELKKPRFQDWSMGYSGIEVLSFADFLDEAFLKKRVEKASRMEVIYFLMAASTRVDLEIVGQR